jgi:sec-independent protein translocase protein TatC
VGQRDDMDSERELTLTQHLEELRWRLIKSVVAVALTTIISFSFLAHRVFDLLKSRAPDDEGFIYTQVTEMFSTYMKVALITGVVLALPFITYQIIMFIAPALTRKEKRALYVILGGGFLLFAGGATFAYFLAVPPAMDFLFNFGDDIARPQIKIDNYVSVTSQLIFLVGLAFETPLIILFLAAIRVVTPRLLSRYRRYAVLITFIVAAIITPTVDPVTQCIVAAPILVLYEVSIWLARLVQRRPAPIER